MNKKPTNNFVSQLLNKYSSPSRQTSKNETMNNSAFLNYYQTLSVHHPDLIVVLSSEGEILSKNWSRINQLLGYHTSKKLNYAKVIPNSTFRVLRIGFEQAIKGISKRYHTCLKNIQGESIYLNITFIPVNKAFNDQPGVHIVIHDNTKFITLQQELHLKKKHLNYAQQIAKLGSWEYDIHEDKFFLSNNCYNIYGYERKETISLEDIFHSVHPEDLQRVTQTVNNALDTGKDYHIEYRIYQGITKELRYVRTKAEVIITNEKPSKLIGVTNDITEQKMLEIELLDQSDNYKHIINNLHSGIFVRDYKKRKTYLSKGAANLYECPLKQLYENDTFWEDSIHPDDRQNVLKLIENIVTGEILHLKYRIICADGTIKWISEQAIPWLDENGSIVRAFGMLTDITKEIELQEQLEYSASHDLLTGLPNQKSLYKKLDTLCNSNQVNNFALLFLDLDRINRIYHSLGIEKGNKVLQQVTQRFSNILPKNSYLKRLAGNSFAAIIPNFSNKKEIFTLCESIITHIDLPFNVDGYELHITISIGISFFPEDGKDKMTILERAHSASYRAKRQGKNNFQIYSVSKDISSYKNFLLEKDMRKAIENEEFELYYQPIVNTHTGTIEGAEALIRWNHNEWGIISPGEFIPLAEENHLIHEIGDWVISNVCAQLRAWKDDGLKVLPININVSPISFLKKDLVENISGHLEHFQIPASYIKLEITESSQLNSEKTVLSTLKKLRELGVKIAIDDFGTGFASLNYLHTFQADVIKIDQVFIHDIHKNDNNKQANAIVSSILYLVKNLNMKSIAEGVEEFEQYEILKQIECDYIQGYLFSKPVPASTFEKMIQTGYLIPNKRKLVMKPNKERRKYFRFEFTNCLLAEMKVTEINKRKVDLRSAQILIENISLGGIKIISSLILPIHSNFKLTFLFEIMNESFQLDGQFIWKDEGYTNMYYYGVRFNISEAEKDRLSNIINQMTILNRQNLNIPDTNFINENPYAYFKK